MRFANHHHSSLICSMIPYHLSVHPLEEQDIIHIVNYWTQSEESFLTGMGVELSLLPKAEQLQAMLSNQLRTPLPEKKAYCLIWLADEIPVGHCNINPINFGHSAYMHLHIWNAQHRNKGIGAHLLRMTIPYFFKDLQLQHLYSEPYSLNPAPHRTLAAAGFQLEKEYVTTPGSLSFEQEVKRWVITKDAFHKLYPTSIHHSL